MKRVLQVRVMSTVAIVCTLPFAVMATEAKLVNPFTQQPATVGELRTAHQQIATTFESKFKTVTPDLHQTSQTNLQDLIIVAQKTRELDRFRAAASEIEPLIESQMEVVHSTSLKAAKSILGSGSLLSIDEMIRRKNVPIDMKIAGNTQLDSDGAIGEQDAVFFAIQPAPSDDHYEFGDVTFFFDPKAILQQGYFSFDSFNVGSPIHTDATTAAENARILKAMEADYRSILFTGYEAYRTLLTISAAQELWLEHQPNLQQEIAVARTVYNNEVSRIEKDFKYEFGSSAEYKQVSICRLLVDLSQFKSAADCESFSKNPGFKDFSFHDVALRGVALRESGASEPQKIVDDFTLLPSYGRHPFPISTRLVHGFWELKVPRQLPLAGHLTAIAYKTSDGGGQAIDTTELEAAIDHYAKQNGLKVTKSIHPISHRVQVTFVR